MARDWRSVKSCKGPDHQDIPVGEVNELQQAVDHAVTRRYQRLDRTQRKAVDQLLKKLVHRRIMSRLIPPIK